MWGRGGDAASVLAVFIWDEMDTNPGSIVQLKKKIQVSGRRAAAGSMGWKLLRSISEISDLKSEWFSYRAGLIPVHQRDTRQLAK